MRNILSIFILLFSCNFANAIENVYSDYTEAKTAAREQHKTFFVMFTATWCAPCQKLKQDTLIPLYDQLTKHSIVYFVDIDKPSERETIGQFSSLPGNWKFQGMVPTYYISNRGGSRILRRATGYMDMWQFAKWYNGQR